MTARPREPLPPPLQKIADLDLWQRFDFQMKHRFQVSENQKFSFPHNVLNTIADKARVFAVQGFGCFGLLGPTQTDSRVRFDGRQDLGAILWVPLIIYGLVTAVRLGLSQYHAGQPPTPLALVVWAIVAWTVVTAYLPMAWDRYLLPIQSVNALLAGLAIAAMRQRIAAPLLALFGARNLGLPHPHRQLRLLLAPARLEHRQPLDAYVFTGRSRHGRHHGPRSTDE